MSKTIVSLFEESVEKFSENTLMWEKRAGSYDSITYKSMREQVHDFAAWLIEQGLEKGDRVALLAEGCSAWMVAELGILYAGAINVPLSIKLNAEEVNFRLKHSGAKMLIVSRLQVPKIREAGVRENGDIKTIVCLNPQRGDNFPYTTMKHALQEGRKLIATHHTKLWQRFKAVEPGDYANICYTSGTTSDPKGIILTHRNYTANVEQSLTLMDIPPYYVTLLILPWDHAFAHTVGLFTFIKLGAAIAAVQVGNTAAEALRNIPVNIKETRPHLLLSVPSLAKNFRKNIESGVAQKGRVAEMLFGWGLKVAYTYNGLGYDSGRGWRCMLRPLVSLFDKILFAKVRQNFGGRLKFFIGGGALLDIELQRFFAAIGIPMLQGYGLSEAAPVISSNAPHLYKFGSSGQLVKHMDFKICDDKGNEVPAGEKGEIVIRGENVMAGYWNNPQASAEALRDGWLYTGDLGYLTSDGWLYVLGRFKSLLIADDGEKYSPEGIEEAIVGQSPYIEQCILHNNQKSYTVAIVVPAKDAIRRWLDKENLSPDSPEAHRLVLELIAAQVAEYRGEGRYASMFPNRWIPSAIAVVSEAFTEQNGMMNSTLKVVRGKVEKTYADRLTHLYTPEAKNIVNEPNMKAVRRLLM